MTTVKWRYFQEVELSATISRARYVYLACTCIMWLLVFFSDARVDVTPHASDDVTEKTLLLSPKHESSATKFKVEHVKVNFSTALFFHES